MAGQLDAVGASSAPGGQQPQDVGQLVPVGTEPVGQPQWSPTVRLGNDHTVALQPTQAVGQDVGSDPGHQWDELAEASRTIEQRLREQQRPAVAYSLECSIQR